MGWGVINRCLGRAKAEWERMRCSQAEVLSFRKAQSVYQSNMRVTSGAQMLKIRGKQKTLISFTG